MAAKRSSERRRGRRRRADSLRDLYGGRCATVAPCTQPMHEARAGAATHGRSAPPRACTLAGCAMQPRFDLVNIAMVYLLAVVVVALRFSRGPAIAAAVLSVAAFDVLFVPPRGDRRGRRRAVPAHVRDHAGRRAVISRLVDSVRRQAAAQAALEIEAETERIRSALLASISHDLRTPLAVMAGASSSLAEGGERMSAAGAAARWRESVFEQAREMSEQVAKVLQMTRLETGAIAARARLGVARRDRRARCSTRLRGTPVGASRHRGAARRPPAGARRRGADRAGARQPARERREAHAGRAPSCACARRRARCRGRRIGRGLRRRPPTEATSSASSRSSTTARCEGAAPAASVSASRSAARSSGCTAARPGPSACPAGGTAFRFTLAARGRRRRAGREAQR